MISSILVGGGTGFIGSALTRSLAQQGKNITFISRTPGPHNITWKDIETQGIPYHVDAVVQLAGANILQKRWSEEVKKELWDSRIETTSSLVKAMSLSKNPPKVFICASAVGIYPTSETEEFDESSAKVADNFAGKLVSAWEKSSELPPSLQDTTRRVVLRFGVVLGKNGGMLQQLLFPYRMCLGGPLGSGKQYMPWIHIKDLVALQEYAIKHENMSGVYNAVAPQIITNQEFSTALAHALNRPAILRIPSFGIKKLFGESAYLVLEGQKVIPKRTLESGFEFKYPTINNALKEIVS